MKNRRLQFITRYNVVFFRFIWFLSMVAALLETYFYPGFVFNHLYIRSIFLYLLLALFGILLLLGPNRKKNKVSDLFKKLNYIATAIFGLSYIFSTVLEKITYANYVFSKFHIQTSQLLILVCISAFTSLVVSKNVLKYIMGPKRTFFRAKMFVGIFLLWILVPDMIEIGAAVTKEILFIVKNPNATYDQKMEEEIGKQFYEYVIFVKENTPENSKILLPPFPAYPWPQTGNGVYMRYFLYPRTLLNGQEYSPGYDLTKEGIDYVLLAWGETLNTTGNHTHGWPKFDVKSDEIVFWLGGRVIKVEKSNYIYHNVEGKELWGIIKVTK